MNTRLAKRCAQVLLAAAGAIGLSGAGLFLASDHSHPVAASTRTPAGADAVTLPTATPPAHSTTIATSEPSTTLVPSSISPPTSPITSGAPAPKTVRPPVTSPAVLNTATTAAPATASPSQPAGECIVTWTAQDGTQSGYDGSCGQAVAIAAVHSGAVVASVTTDTPFAAN